MQLKIIGSNSEGNAYILESETEALLIECGVRMDLIKQSVKYNIAKISGCLVSHEHKDHCKSVDKIMAAGINVWASYGTHGAMRTEGHHRARFLHLGSIASIGGFKIKPFLTKHDAAEPMGFLIHHAESGVILFLTDSYFSEYHFEGLNNIIIEANYSAEILASRTYNGDNPRFLRDRVIGSHMNLNTCKELLMANDLSSVNNIVLIHLSDSNSDEVDFVKQIQETTGKAVHAARNGMVISFNSKPF